MEGLVFRVTRSRLCVALASLQKKYGQRKAVTVAPKALCILLLWLVKFSGSLS